MAELTRRQVLRVAGIIAGGALVSRFEVEARAAALPTPWQAPAGQGGQLAAMRAQMGAAAIQVTKLGDGLTMLSGPGGNVVVLHGPDGKVVVDTFVQPAWARLRDTLNGLGQSPVKVLINTHWHFDHADNNAAFASIGSTIVAHANTRKRLSEPQALMGMQLEPAPPRALPTQTFTTEHSLKANGDDLALSAVPPAHTDTDIFIHYRNANLLHMGDVFFNGTYPFIDIASGGNINGMIGGADRALKLADARTRIVPGHGALADRAVLAVYRDVLAAVRDRVQKLKTAGRSLADVQAAKPSAEFDAAWGSGMMAPDAFIALVYNTL